MYPQVIILWSTIKILEIFRIAMLVQMTKQNSITRKTQIFCITLFCSVFISFENNLFKVTILRSICNLLYLKNSLMIRFLIFLYLYSIIYIFATIKFSSYFLLIFFLHISPEKSAVITTTHFKICPIFLWNSHIFPWNFS